MRVFSPGSGPLLAAFIMFCWCMSKCQSWPSLVENDDGDDDDSTPHLRKLRLEQRTGSIESMQAGHIADAGGHEHRRARHDGPHNHDEYRPASAVSATSINAGPSAAGETVPGIGKSRTQNDAAGQEMMPSGKEEEANNNRTAATGSKDAGNMSKKTTGSAAGAITGTERVTTTVSSSSAAPDLIAVEGTSQSRLQMSPSASAEGQSVENHAKMVDISSYLGDPDAEMIVSNATPKSSADEHVTTDRRTSTTTTVDPADVEVFSTSKGSSPHSLSSPPSGASAAPLSGAASTAGASYLHSSGSITFASTSSSPSGAENHQRSSSTTATSSPVTLSPKEKGISAAASSEVGVSSSSSAPPPPPSSSSSSSGVVVTDLQWEELRRKLHVLIDGLPLELFHGRNEEELRGTLKRVLDEAVMDCRFGDKCRNKPLKPGEYGDEEEEQRDYGDAHDEESRHPFDVVHSDAHARIYKLDLPSDLMLQVQRSIHTVFDVIPTTWR